MSLPKSQQLFEVSTELSLFLNVFYTEGSLLYVTITYGSFFYSSITYVLELYCVCK